MESDFGLNEKQWLKKQKKKYTKLNYRFWHLISCIWGHQNGKGKNPQRLKRTECIERSPETIAQHTDSFIPQLVVVVVAIYSYFPYKQQRCCKYQLNANWIALIDQNWRQWNQVITFILAAVWTKLLRDIAEIKSSAL